MDESSVSKHILDIEAQINAAMQGRTNVINCPYCSGHNRAENVKLCCEDFGLVVRAILRKQAQQDVLDTAKRITDKAYEMGMIN